MSYVLGIDLGTTYTSAAIVADGRAEVVQLGLRSSVVPTVVFLTEDGEMLTGETANRRAITAPARVAREFKRRVGDTAPLLLGGTPMAPQALMARMLRWVVDHVTEERGAAPDHVAVSHPANWGPYKLDLLDQAVRLADLESATTITEPEAAARYYASTQRLSAGDIVAVYDLGGGTFDAAVLEVTHDGFAILGTPEGIDHLGGIDIDEAVFGLVARELGDALEGLDPDDPLVTAAAARLRRDCVEAKEALSSDPEAIIPVMLPTVQREVRITRDELEALVRPTLTATIGALERALRSAQVRPDQLAAVLLVGGSSRMPLVSAMVGESLGRRVAVDTHPKHAVSLGTALEAEAAVARARGASGPGAAEIVPPRDTPPATPGGPTPPPPLAGVAGVVPGRSRPTVQSPTPTPPPPPPAGPTGGGHGDGAGEGGDGNDGGDGGIGGDEGDGGDRAGIDWRRVLFVGAPLLAIVLVAAILIATRGGGDDDAGAGGSAEFDRSATTDVPAEVAAESSAPVTTADAATAPSSSPSTTSAPDPVTTAPLVVPVVTEAAAVESAELDVTTTEPSVATTEPYVVTTESSMATMELDVATTEPYVETTEPGVVTTEPYVETTEPAVATTEPYVATTEPVVETTEPYVATTEPVVATTEPVVETTEPYVATTEPVVATTEPVVETTEPVETTEAAETTEPAVATTERATTSTSSTSTTSTTTSSTTTTPPTTVAQPSVQIAGLGVGRRIAVSDFPDGVGVDASGRLWTASSFGDEVTRIDPVTGRRDVVPFETGEKPLAVLASPDAVYVSLAGSAQIARIEPDTLAVDRVTVSEFPAFLAWGEEGSLWSIADTGLLDRIDPATFTVTATVEVPGAKGVAVIGGTAWVTAGPTNELVEIDVASGQILARHPIGTGPDAIVADGNAVWVTNRGEGTVVRFDTVYRQVTGRVTTGTAPAGIAIDGDRVWVIDVEEGTLVLVDRPTATVVDTLAVGRQPLGLHPFDDDVWVSLAGDDALAEVHVWVDAPTAPRAEIVGIEVVGQRYVPTFVAHGFTPAIGGDLHVHLYWNTSPTDGVGVPGGEPWLVWDQPVRVDDGFFDVANRPPGANAACIVLANTAHEVADVDGDGAVDYDTGNCLPLPDPAA